MGSSTGSSSGSTVVINGVCGTSNGMTMSNPPTTGLCTAGAPSAVGGFGPWIWSCGGSNGGTTAHCMGSVVTSGSSSGTASSSSSGSSGAGTSPDGTVITLTTEQIIDAQGHVWTIKSDRTILINGQLAGFSLNVVELAWVGGLLYQENQNGNWWYWDFNLKTWMQTGNPFTGPSVSDISHDGTIITLTTERIVDSARNIWTIVADRTILVDGIPAGFSANVTELAWLGGKLYQENQAGGWWFWDYVNEIWIATTNPFGGSASSSGTTTSSSSGTIASSSSGTTSSSSGSTPIPVNGVCGSDNGMTLSTTPANLCTVGMPSAVGGTGPWIWSCAGSNGGGTGHCTANSGSTSSSSSSGGPIVPAICGSAAGQTFSSAPTTNLCATGTASGFQTDGTAAWIWICSSGNGVDANGCFALAKTAGGSSGGGTATGIFHVENGQIIDPNGNTFVAKGINVLDWQMGTVSTSSTGAPLTSMFPRINMIRLACNSTYDSVDALMAFVTTMTSQNIVVEIEDHTSPFTNTSSNVYSGSSLSNELAWYNSIASAFAGNPYVWFGTMNEPEDVFDRTAVSDQEAAIYNAIRGMGNNNPIMLEQIEGYTDSGLNPASYANMTNVVWDTHYYGWVANFSSDPGAISSALTAQVNNAQSITSADGVVPVIVGEYGISSTGYALDPNGTQVVSGVDASGYGTLAWAWSAGVDTLTDDGVNPNAFGQQVAQHISTGN